MHKATKSSHKFQNISFLKNHSKTFSFEEFFLSFLYTTQSKVFLLHILINPIHLLSAKVITVLQNHFDETIIHFELCSQI